MIDIAAVVTSLVLICAYQYYLRTRLRRDPLYTMHGVNVAARTAWVEMVMSSDKPDVLAVQTFFYSVPLVFWMFGPLFMITATILLILALYPLDRAPRSEITTVGSRITPAP